MRTLSYVSGATGESIGFEGPLYGGTLTGLRARIWDYSLASRGITGITRKTRETTIPVKIHDSPETIDLLRRLADADMAPENQARSSPTASGKPERGSRKASRSPSRPRWSRRS